MPISWLLDVIQESQAKADPCASGTGSGTGSGTLDMTVYDMKNPPVLSPDHLHSCPWI